MTKPQKLLSNALLSIASFVLSIFAIEWGLLILSFPTEIQGRTNHPPNHEEVRSTIEFQYTFKTNSQGLRYREIPLAKAKNTHRTFISGDSFTEGYGVESEQRFSNLLEQNFVNNENPVQFINGGLSGTGPSAYGQLVFNIGVKYEIDALLICVYVNDLANSPDTPPIRPFTAPRYGIRKFAHSLWPRIYTQLKYLQLNQQYKSTTQSKDFIVKVSNQAKKLGISDIRIGNWTSSLPQNLVKATNEGRFNGSVLSLGILYPEYWVDSIDITSSKAKKKWNHLTQTLSEIVSLAKEKNIEAAVVLIPSPFQYDPLSHTNSNAYVVSGSTIKKKWLEEETQIQVKMRGWSQSERVPFLDLTPICRKAVKSGQKLNWELDGHWNSQGHQVAATAMTKWLNGHNVYSFIRMENPSKPSVTTPMLKAKHQHSAE